MLECRLAQGKTVLSRVYAASPLRLLTPRNHGLGAWIFSTTFGGGMVDGDRVELDVTLERGTTALLGTQASTKIYRSQRGCGQRFSVRVEEDATAVLVPDPVVCFGGARYSQRIDVSLSAGASALVLDGYTAGRAARGERWAFTCLDTKTTIDRGGRAVMIDATRLDAAHGSIPERMGPFDVVLTLAAFGPRFEALRAAMPVAAGESARGEAVAAVSALGADGAILRVAADRFERASRVLHPCFVELARLLGDDPFARKW